MNEAAPDEIKVILFRVNEQLLGIRIEFIREVLEYMNPTPVPDSPKWIAGVIDVSDRILPVASLHTCLYGSDPQRSGSGHLLSVYTDEKEVAFTTDLVTGIRSINSDDVLPPTDLTSRIHDTLIEGVTRIEEEVAILIDPEKAVDGQIMSKVLEELPEKNVGECKNLAGAADSIESNEFEEKTESDDTQVDYNADPDKFVTDEPDE